MYVVDASELAEPEDWNIGGEYYVVTRGSEVGVFHKWSASIFLSPYTHLSPEQFRSEVRSSVQFPSSHWVAFKTWGEAVKFWEAACRKREVFLFA